MAVVTAIGLTSTSAVAQQPEPPAAQQQPSAVKLPDVTVVTKNNEQTPKKRPLKKARASKASAKATAAASASPQQVTVTDEAPKAETAIGPVQGLVATRTGTASKTDTPIIEVPKTVNVVTKDQISQQQPQSVRQALSYTPGVQDQTGAASILDNIAVRGFTAPIFLDALRLPTDGAIGFARIRLEPYGLERLEVLKGPSSALYGYSATGGIINAISKRPQDTPSGEAFVQYGTDDHKEAGFDVTGPLDPAENFSYRVVGLVRDTDLDFNFASQQRYYIAPSLTWHIDPDTNLTILASAQHDGGFGPFQFVPFSLTKNSAPFGRISRSTYLGQPDYDNYNEDQYQIGYEFEHRLNSIFQFRQNVRYSTDQQNIVAMRAAGVQADMETINRSANAVVANFDGIAVDNQVQADFGTGPIAHRVLAGLDYQRVSSGSQFWVNSNGIPTINAYHPTYDKPIPSPFEGTAFVLSDSVLQDTGLYLQDQIKLGGWIATLGGRSDWADTTLHDKRTAAVEPDQDADDQAWTGFAGLSYLFENGIAPYFSYSTSFQPVSGSSLLDVAGAPLKPTTGEAYEVGVKYQPPGTKTLLTASAFQITQQNISTSDLATAGISQTGEVRVRGIEFEGKASLTDNFDVIAGYSYLQPIVTENSTDPSVVGNDFLQISRQTASTWGIYTWHDGAFRGLSLGAGVRYFGPQYAEITDEHKLSGYALMDAVMIYDLANISPKLSGTKLQLNGTNLLDKYYVSTCQGENFCQLGAGRSVLATIRYNW
jgi:iron complex outermembrane receptor protein